MGALLAWHCHHVLVIHCLFCHRSSAGGLTIHSSRHRFAARLNSGVRPHYELSNYSSTRSHSPVCDRRSTICMGGSIQMPEWCRDPCRVRDWLSKFTNHLVVRRSTQHYSLRLSVLAFQEAIGIGRIGLTIRSSRHRFAASAPVVACTTSPRRSRRDLTQVLGGHGRTQCV